MDAIIRNLIFYLVLASPTICYFPSFEYKYNYWATLSLSAPEIKAQDAGTGVEAEIVLQMKTMSRGIAKLNDFRVGTYHKILGRHEECIKPTVNITTKFSYKEKLEQPFGFNLNPKEGPQMIVQDGEEEFLTNVRKSIMDLFYSNPITRAFNSELPANHQEFSTYEDSIFGRCLTHYAIKPIDPKLMPKGAVKKHVEHYLKRVHNETVVLPLADLMKKYLNRDGDFFVFVKKTVKDFSNCQDSVVLTRSSVGNMKEAGSEQFENLMSRLSHTEIILYKAGLDLGIFSTKTEGLVMVNPFGFNTEKIHARTTRWAILANLYPIKKPLTLPKYTKEVKTKSYEVASSFPPAKNQKVWINSHDKGNKFFPTSEFYMTGISPSREVIQKSKLVITKLINEAIEIMLREPKPSHGFPAPWDEAGALDTSYLMEAVFAMKVLPQKHIEDLFNEIHDKPSDKNAQFKKMLLTDIAAATGTLNPIKVILEMMKNGKISEFRSSTLWMTMANQIVSTEVVPVLMKYVMSIDTTKEIVYPSIVHVNFAAVVNKVCINPMTSQYSIEKDLYGSKACHPNDILDVFLPYLEEKLKKSSKSNETAYLIQTLSTLGSPNAFPLLKKIVNQHYSTDTGTARARALAIFAMEQNKMSKDMKKLVFESLMEIFENLSEDEGVRLSAFITLLTWEPDAYWWQYVAKKTWEETSVTIGAFVANTIKTVAKTTSPVLKKQSEGASFAESLLKPYPATLSYSLNTVFAKYFKQKELDTRFNFEWVPNTFSIVPVEAYVHLSSSFGGLDFNLFEMAFSSTHFKNLRSLLFPQTYDLNSTEDLPSSFYSRNVENGILEFLNNVNGFKSSQKEMHNNSHVNFLFRAFDNIYAYIPADVNSKWFKMSAEKKEELVVKGNFMKFVTPMSLQIALPTELGIPLIFENSLSIFTFMNYSLKSKTPFIPTSNAIGIQLEQDLRVSTKLFSRLKSYVPWLNTTIMVGVDNVRRVNVPLNATMFYNHGVGHSYIYTTFKSNQLNKFPLFYGHNIPFTAVKPMLPGRNLSVQTDMKIIYEQNAPLTEETFDILSKETKLKLSMLYQGDNACPFTTANMIDIIRNPEKSLTLLASSNLRASKFSLDLDPTTSESDTIEIKAEILHTPDKTEIQELKTEKIFSRLFGNSKTSIMRNTDQDNLKLKQNAKKMFDYDSSSASIVLTFLGYGHPQQYGLSAYYEIKNKTKRMNRYHGHVYYAIGNPPKDEFKGLDIKYDAFIPRIRNFDDLKYAIKTGMGIKYKGEAIPFVFPDKTKNIAKFEANMKLSKDLRKRILDELNEKCPKDPDYFLLENTNTEFTYDEAELIINYNNDEVSPKLLNFTYNIKDLVKGLYTPHYLSYRLRDPNPSQVLKFKAKRILQSKRYKVSIESPQENTFIGDVKMPFGINKIAYYEDFTKHHRHHKNSSNDLVPVFCEISSNATKTFDGLTISFPLNFCPTFSSFYMAGNDFFLLSKLNDRNEPMLIFVGVVHQFILKVTANEIMLNGKDVTSEVLRKNKIIVHEVVVAEVTKRKESTVIHVLNSTELELGRQSFRIYPTQYMRGKVHGLCGNFDGNAENDMEGQFGCLYHSQKLLGATWTLYNIDPKCLTLKWLQELEKENIIYKEKYCPRHNTGV